MELNSISLSVFTRLADVVFEKAKEEAPAMARNSGIWVVESIPQNSGDVRDYQEIDLNLYAGNKPQGDQAPRAKVQLGYNKEVRVRRVARDIGITYEMRHFNKYPEVISRLTSLGKMGPNRMELDLSHRIGFGTATTYTDMDGATIDISTGDALSLFNTAHTLTGSATTYRNRLAGNPQISKGALQGMERLIAEETLNNLGEKVTMPFDILFTSDDPETQNTAMEYLRSVAAPDFANSGVTNTYRAKYKHVTLPLLATTASGGVDASKRRFWGLSSSSMSDMHLAIWEEPHIKSPSNLNAGEEFSTDDWNYGMRAGWGIGSVTGRCIKFSSGDGTA